MVAAYSTRHLAVFFLAAVILLPRASASADRGASPELAIAILLYKAAVAVEFPFGSFETAEDPINLCVAGGGRNSRRLVKLLAMGTRGRSARGRKFVARTLSRREASKSGARCHLLFVGRDLESAFSQLTISPRARRALVVVERQELLGRGAAMALSFDGNKLSFVVHLGALNERQLRLEEIFLSRARNVQGRKSDSVPIVQVSGAKLEQHLGFLIRAIGYDRAFESRIPSEIKFGIVTNPKVPSSVYSAEEVFYLLTQKIFKQGMRGRKVEVVVLEIAPRAGLIANQLAGVSFIYLTRGLSDAEVGAIVEITRKSDVLTIAGVSDYVQLGVSLGVIERGSQSRVMVNRAASIEEGAAFSSQLLRISEVVGDAR